MSLQIPSRPSSAGGSSSRIEFIASRRLAAGWLAWAGLAVLSVLQSALAWPVRLPLIAAVVVIIASRIRRHVLLRGARALRAVEWPLEAGDAYYVHLGPQRRRLAASPVGCRKYGAALWLLRFETAEGACQAILDVQRQPPVAIRRLGRRLFAAEAPARAVRAAPRPQAATMPPKV